jgi:hypothetical protein
MSYAKAKQQYEETKGVSLDEPTKPRTDYRCAAHGCPNAGCMDDEGEHKRGRCFWHWREPDPMNWPAITQRIRENFEEMRNFGPKHVRSEQSRKELLRRLKGEA